MKRQNISFFLILFLFIFLCSSCNKFSNKTILFINELNFNNSLNIGDSCDLIYSNLQKNAVVISKNDRNNFKIKLNQPIYFKLNNETQNKFSLDSIYELNVNKTIITKVVLNNLLSSIEKTSLINRNFDQNYISLKYLVLKLNPNADTTGIFSIISRKNNVLILLDNNVIINGTIKAIDSFTVESNELKFECFSVTDYFNYYASSSDKSKHFLYFDSTSRHVLVRPIYTPFGSSEILLSSKNGINNINVKFNRIYQYVINNNDIHNLILENGNIPISYIQNFESLDPGKNIVIPKFSATKYTTIPILETNQDISQNNNQDNNYKIEHYNLFTLFLSFSPLLFVLIFILTILKKNSFLSILYGYTSFMSDKSERKTWAKYFAILSIFISIYFLYRILIAYNLYITAPYFIYFLPMQIIIAPLTLFFLFQLWVRFIYKFSFDESEFKKDEPKNYSRKLFKAKIKYNLLVCFFYFLILGLLYFIQNKYYSGILTHQLKFDFYLVNKMELLSNIMGSSLSPLLVLLSTIILFHLSCLLPKTLFLKISSNRNIVKCILLTPVLFLNNAYSSILLLFFIVSTLIDIQNKKPYIKFVDVTLTYLITLFSKFISFVIIIFNKILKILKRKNINIKLIDDLLIQNSILVKSVFFNAIIVSIIAFFKGDFGYIINTLPLILSVFWIIFFTTTNPKQNIHLAREEQSNSIRGMIGVFTLVLIIFASLGYLFARFSTTTEGRSNARFTALYRFENMEEQGLKKTEGISQFFVVLGKYLLPNSNVIHENRFHTIISGNYDPIVINDLSFPVNTGMLFGVFGPIIYVFLIFSWIFLFYKIHMSTFLTSEKYNSSGSDSYLHSFGIIKIICLFYLVGSGTWLILSYFSILPFTGRLIFGFGQDSAAELLETIIIFTCFGLLYNSKEIRIIKS